MADYSGSCDRRKGVHEWYYVFGLCSLRRKPNLTWSEMGPLRLCLARQGLGRADAVSGLVALEISQSMKPCYISAIGTIGRLIWQRQNAFRNGSATPREC